MWAACAAARRTAPAQQQPPPRWIEGAPRALDLHEAGGVLDAVQDDGHVVVHLEPLARARCQCVRRRQLQRRSAIGCSDAPTGGGARLLPQRWSSACPPRPLGWSGRRSRPELSPQRLPSWPAAPAPHPPPRSHCAASWARACGSGKLFKGARRWPRESPRARALKRVRARWGGRRRPMSHSCRRRRRRVPCPSSPPPEPCASQRPAAALSPRLCRAE